MWLTAKVKRTDKETDETKIVEISKWTDAKYIRAIEKAPNLILMENIHPSDSIEQRDVEKKVINLLEQQFGFKLTSGSISLDNKVHIQVDAYNKNQKVFIEIYSGTGNLKPAQIKKVITDGFKLLTLQKIYMQNQDCRKIICFVDNSVLKIFQSDNWYSKAFKEFGIETIIQEISYDDRLILQNAKIRQIR